MPESLTERLTLLDQLDVVGNLEQDVFPGSLDAETVASAKALKSRLEAANERLFQCARSEIATQGNSLMLRQWLMEFESGERSQCPYPGLGFDLRDEIVSGVLRLGEPEEAKFPTSPEMTFYQPTPARHILDMIRVCNLSGDSDDELIVDLGSGLGHVPLLVSILTGHRTLGVEIQPAYVAIAQEAARGLDLKCVEFVAEDARMAKISGGTVFYLFTPFTGLLLRDVLDRLHRESRTRRIRICSLGPSTRTLQEQWWLRARRQPETGRVAVFESR